MGHVRRWISRHVACPLMLTVRSVSRRAGLRPMRQLRRFRELARSEPQAWQEFRDRQLRRMLDHALREIPFYRHLASRLGPLVQADPMRALRQFPILTKRELQQCESQLLSRDVPPGGRHVDHTSGSTGEPTRFWHDHRHDAIRLLEAYRNKAYAGWRLGDPVAIIGTPLLFGGGPLRFYWEHSVPRRILNRLGRTYVGLNVFHIRPETNLEFLEAMERQRPVIIRAITSAADEFAAFIEAEGLADRTRALRLRGVICCCEKLYAFQRMRIERVFGCGVFDLYGSNEMGVVAMECSVHRGLHVSADSVIVEIVGEDGEPVPTGERGRVIVTNLWNLGFSLIRYDLDDVGRFLPDDGPCPCGVTFPRMAPVEGRTADFFTMQDGTRLHGDFFTHLFYGLPGVRQFRVAQEAVGEVVISFVGDREVIESRLPALLEEVPRGLRAHVQFRESLPLTSAGKRQYIISRLSTSGGER